MHYAQHAVTELTISPLFISALTMFVGSSRSSLVRWRVALGAGTQ